MANQEKKILVAGPAWVGDMVMAQSLFKTIKQRDGATAIDVIAPAWSLPMLARMPEVRKAIAMPVGHGKFSLLTRYRLGRELKRSEYDQAIIIPRSFKSALSPFFASIPRRTGYRGEMRYGLLNDIRPLDKSILLQTVQRYVALGLEASDTLPPSVIPQPELMVDEENQARLLQTLKLNIDRPIIGMMPGAEYGPAKCWPPEYFAALAKKLIDAGNQVWLFGSQKDKVVADKITQMSERKLINLCGRTEMVDVVDLIALAQTVVSNDSGLMHVAAAVGVNLVAIYGSSTPDYTPPLTDRAEIQYLNLECSPCFKRQCPYGHYNCLKNISVEQVSGVLQQTLKVIQ